MQKVMLRLRELASGTSSVKELDDVNAAIAWLAERPSMVEVLGVVFEGLSREENARMRAAMRPLDDAEAKRSKELDDAEEAGRLAVAEQRRRDDEAKAATAREAAKTADPKRPMELRYRYDKPELENTDALDQRAITDVARAAVMAWIEERNEWVASRNQVVGEAKVSVYPDEVPAKKERVVGGTFLPVTAPPKGETK